MPNQRDKDKKFVGAWLPGQLYKSVKRTARQRKLTLSEWVTEKLTQAADDPGQLDALALHDSAAPTPPPPSPPAGKGKKPRLKKIPPVPPQEALDKIQPKPKRAANE